MSTATADNKKKETSLDLRERKHQLEREIEEKLQEAHGEITEEIDDLFVELADLAPNVKEKIESLRWAYKKVGAQVEANKAAEKFWKKEANQVKKTTKAREKNQDSIKNLVLLNLHTLEEESIRLSDGNKIYIRDFYKATVTDEEAAYQDLKNTDMVSRDAVLDGEGVDQVKDAILTTLENIQTGDGEPVNLPRDVHEKLGHALDVLNTTKNRFNFDGRALNSEVKRLHGVRQEELPTLYQELQAKRDALPELSNKIADLDPESNQRIELEEKADLIEDDIAELQMQISKIEDDYSIAGVEYEVNESVFGL